MISWRETAAPEGPLTFFSSRARHSQEFFTQQGNTFANLTTLMFSESSFFSSSPTRSDAEFEEGSTTSQGDSTLPLFISYEKLISQQVLGSFTDVSNATLTSVSSGFTRSVVLGVSRTVTRAGTTWLPETSTTQTSLRQISSLTTTNISSAATVTSDNSAGWATSAQTVTAPTTTFSNVTITRDTTTLEEGSQVHIEGIYNTIYQANTRNEADNAEVIYVLTHPAQAYRAAASEATSTTRTTISAATATTEVSTALIFSSNVSTITNESITASENYRSRTLREATSSRAEYFQLPPFDVGEVSFLEPDSTATEVASTEAFSQTLAAFYDQTSTTDFWFRKLIVLPVSGGDLQYDTSTTQWASAERTTTAQNLTVGISPDLLSSTATSATRDPTDPGATAATGSTRDEASFEQAQNTMAAAPQISRTTANTPPVSFSFYYPIGAALGQSEGAGLGLNLPFTFFPVTNYTALQSPYVTTVMPVTWSQLFGNEDEEEEEENAELSSASISISGASLTWKTAEEGNSESGTAAFSTAGQAPEVRRVFSTRLTAQAVNTFGTGVGIVGAGAYRTKVGTLTQSAFSISYAQSEMNGFTPLRHIAPGTNTATALLWTVPRNSTALPPT